MRVVQAVKIWAELVRGKADALAAGSLKRHCVFCELRSFSDKPIQLTKKARRGKFPRRAWIDLTY